MQFCRKSIREGYYAMHLPCAQGCDDAAWESGERFVKTLCEEQMVLFADYMTYVSLLHEEERKLCFQRGWLAAQRHEAAKKKTP